MEEITSAGLIALLEEEIDGMPKGMLNIDTDLKSVPQWDSLAILIVIALVDSDYGISLSGREISACSTIRELIDLIKSKSESRS